MKGLGPLEISDMGDEPPIPGVSVEPDEASAEAEEALDESLEAGVAAELSALAAGVPADAIIADA